MNVRQRAHLVDHADQAKTDNPSLTKLRLLPLDVGDNQIRDETVEDRILSERLGFKNQTTVSVDSSPGRFSGLKYVPR